MKDIFVKNWKKMTLGAIMGLFGAVLLGSMPENKPMAAKPMTANSEEIVCYTSEAVSLYLTEQEIKLAIDSLTGESIARLESMVPDDVKCIASQELGSASRAEYIKWFYHQGYIPGELLGLY